MKIHIDEITADIQAADFSTDAAAMTFAAKMGSGYSVRELLTYEGFLPRWSFTAIGEKQRFMRTWACLIQEARSLIVQVRTLGAGAIKNPLVRGANGAMLPNPQMCDDLDDDLFGMTIAALRRIAARAIENNATVQGVAHKVDAARDEIADSADRTQFAIQKGFEGLKPTQDQVEYLAGKKRTRSINGKKAQKKANADPDITDAKKKAAANMARALRKVREAMLDNPAQNRLHVCRHVCRYFTPLTTAKNDKGEYIEYTPLYDWTDTHEIQPETLDRAYREKYGTKKEQKAKSKTKAKRGRK